MIASKVPNIQRQGDFRQVLCPDTSEAASFSAQLSSVDATAVRGGKPLDMSEYAHANAN